MNMWRAAVARWLHRVARRTDPNKPSTGLMQVVSATAHEYRPDNKPYNAAAALDVILDATGEPLYRCTTRSEWYAVLDDGPTSPESIELPATVLVDRG